MSRRCECGSEMDAYDWSCKACGKSSKVRAEYLVGKDILPEPPVDLWAAQDRYMNSQKKKKSRKVRTPKVKIHSSNPKSGIYNFTTVFLLAVASLAVIVFRSPLAANYKLLPYSILALTLLVTVLGLRSDQFFHQITMKPTEISRNKEYFRLISSGFGHIDAGHFLLNSFVLYSFGPYLMKFFIDTYGENAPLAFLSFYVSAIICSDIPDLIRHRKNSQYSAIGASGAIAAVIAGVAIADPTLKFQLLFLPPQTAVPGIVFAFGYLAISLYLDYRGTGRVAHLAHAAGTIYGLAVIAMIRFILI